MTDPQTPDVAAERPPYLLAGLVALGALVLYVLTLAPTTQYWDASEYITAAHALGIPHPPGSPLFVILAHAWGLLPLGADYARRINLFAAVTSAAAAGIWFLIGERWLRAIVAPAGRRRLVAAAGALVGATAFTVWNQSVVNEKVYTLSVLTIALVLWLTLRWADQPASTRRDHYLVLIAYLLALTATNHLMGVLAAPAVLVYVLLTDPRALLRPRFLVAAALVVAVGTSVNLFIPIRAHFDPYLNQGEATTWPALKSVLAREQFGKPSVFDNPMYRPGPDNPGHTLVLYGQQLLNYVQYFSWQFGRDWLPGMQRGLAVLFAALGLLGARRQWRADRRAAFAMTTLILTLTVALVFYLNFKWGYSQPYRGPGLEHEVRERDYFFVASFAAWGVWVAMGLATLMEWIEEARLARATASAPVRLWAPSVLVLLLALIPLAGNRLTASRSDETLARDYAHDLLQSVDPYALVVTAGDNDTFPLWYAQEVDGVRRDVSVLVMSLANTGWYLRQLQRRAPLTFDAGAAPGLYRGRVWPRPTSPWMSRYYLGSPADTLPEYIPLAQPAVGYLGPIAVKLDPGALGRPYLLRSDLAVLQIIKDELGKRPIYFSTSTGNYADQLGLSPYLVGEGLVRRLVPRPVAASDSVRLVEGRGFVNVPRSAALLFEVYRGGETAARPRPRGWVDVPSQTGLLGYLFAYDTIAAVLRESDPPRAARAVALRDAILANTSYAPAGGRAIDN
jgi:transmembrane protein TMEM260 (protein O-mannosyltransferase)